MKINNYESLIAPEGKKTSESNQNYVRHKDDADIFDENINKNNEGGEEDNKSGEEDNKDNEGGEEDNKDNEGDEKDNKNNEGGEDENKDKSMSVEHENKFEVNEESKDNEVEENKELDDKERKGSNLSNNSNKSNKSKSSSKKSKSSKKSENNNEEGKDLKSENNSEEGKDLEPIEDAEQDESIDVDKSNIDEDKYEDNSEAEDDHKLKSHEKEDDADSPVIDKIKSCLNETNQTIRNLIKDKTLMAKDDDEDNEYPIIMNNEFITIIQNAFNDKLSSKQIEELEKILKESSNPNDNYVSVSDLLGIFQELSESETSERNEDDEIIEGLNNFDEDTAEFVRELVNYIDENKTSIKELVKNDISQQTVTLGSEKMVIDVIDSDKFYEYLKEIKVTEEIYNNFKSLLIVNPDHPNILSIKKIEVTLNYAKFAENNENGSFLYIHRGGW